MVVVTSLFNFGISSFPDNMDMLFKTVRSPSHEQSIPTCLNKPVNNTGWPAQSCSSWLAQSCSSWPAQSCSSLTTGKNKLCVFTCVVRKMATTTNFSHQVTKTNSAKNENKRKMTTIVVILCISQSGTSVIADKQ